MNSVKWHQLLLNRVVIRNHYGISNDRRCRRSLRKCIVKETETKQLSQGIIRQQTIGIYLFKLGEHKVSSAGWEEIFQVYLQHPFAFVSLMNFTCSQCTTLWYICMSCIVRQCLACSLHPVYNQTLCCFKVFCRSVDVTKAMCCFRNSEVFILIGVIIRHGFNNPQ